MLTLSSGSTANTPYIAVDVDLQHGLWRIMHLNDTDVANIWVAKNYSTPVSDKDRAPELPEFAAISLRLIKNGTFNKVGEVRRHMYFPELELQIANMYDFLEAYEFEPFLRVFMTRGRTDEERQKMADAKWNNKPDENIVLRTASFGHWRKELHMCAREGELSDYKLGRRSSKLRDSGYREEGQESGGISDDLLVPMAVISAERLRTWEMDLREFSDSAEA